MTDLRKAAEMALAALKGAAIHDPEAVQEEIAVLEQALAEAEEKEKEKQKLASILNKYIRIDPDTGNVGIGS